MPRAIDDGTGLSFEFFGEMDRNKDGKIAAEYPCWMNANIMDALEDEISIDEMFVRQSTDPSNKATRMEALAAKRERLKAINLAMPILKGDNLHRVEKALGEISAKIAEAYFTKNQMDKGGASLEQKEFLRMTERLMQISPEVAAIAVKCNVPVPKDYKITRTHAEKMYQICSRALGRDIDLEVLRKAA